MRKLEWEFSLNSASCRFCGLCSLLKLSLCRCPYASPSNSSSPTSLPVTSARDFSEFSCFSTSFQQKQGPPLALSRPRMLNGIVHRSPLIYWILDLRNGRRKGKRIGSFRTAITGSLVSIGFDTSRCVVNKNETFSRLIELPK